MNALDYQILARLLVLEGGSAGGAFTVAGAGLTSSGATINAIANADGSVVVNANDIQVGVVSDTQHGTRSGGTLHSAASTSAAGFLAALDKATLLSMGIYAVTGGGVTAGITAAIAAAQAAGLKRVHLGDGTWTVDCGGLSNDAAMITVPSGFQITGNGQGRTIISVTNTTTGAGLDGVAVFRTAANAVNVLFQGLHFKGTNTVPSYPLNNQNVCVDVYWIGTSTDILTTGCTFENLWGFTVHDRQGTTNRRIDYTDNTAINCANGVNINASHSRVARSTFINSEGSESSGAFNTFSDLIFKNAIGVAVTVGGFQGAGASYPGNVVNNVTVDGGTGLAFTIADAAHGTVLSNCYARNCATGGLVISGPVAPPTGCIIVGNTFDSNCADPGANLNAIYVANGSKHLFIGNRAFDSATAGFNQKYGLNLSASECVLYGNFFNGTLKDISVGAGATNTRLRGNVYANNSLEIIGTGTVSPERVTSKVAGDVVETSRLGTASTLDDRAYFARFADGKMEWGNNSDLLDTNLYRSAANILKTDDALVVVGSVTAGSIVTAGSLNAGSIVIPAWTAPTLLSSWVNYDLGYTLAGHYLDATGRVYLRGLVKSGTVNGVAAIFTLPSGSRPTKEHIYSVSSNNSIGQVRVQANGNVVAHTPSSNVYVSLDGISFLVT